MKYSNTNKPLVCMMTQSTCYKGTTTMTPKGVLWHSTGANNPNLKRYVQPDDNAANRDEMLALLGKNTNKNDWNHTSVQAGLNCWIGKLADGTVTTVQVMPWNYKPWGCGAGSKGSCNNGWMQFEICEDGLTDKTYFEAVYKEACEITAYYCQMYNLDPHGTVTFNGVKVPVILDHSTSCALGLGSNHGDVMHWFKKYGKTLDDVRNDVAALMGGNFITTTTPKEDNKIDGEYTKGYEVKLSANFTSDEFDCQGKGCCSKTLVDQKLVNYLQDIRAHFNKPVYISSGYRCPTHNSTVSKSKNSYHTKGQAADIYITGVNPIEIARYAEQKGILGIGLYETNKDGHFVHIDTRTSKAFWYGQAEAPRTTFLDKDDSSGSVSKPAISQPVTPTPSTNSQIKVGDKVKVASNAIYTNGKEVPTFVKNLEWIVHSVTGSRIVINKSVDGKYSIMSPVDSKYLTVVEESKETQTTPAQDTFKPYIVRVTATLLNYRKGPGSQYPVNGQIKNGGAYTIVEEKDGWGRLKSGAGWIMLDYVEKI